MPVIGLRLLDGRVGSTLLMRLLATSDEVAMEHEYPAGERRYLSYCLRIATWVGTPWNPAVHPDVTELLFGTSDRGGPIPFEPTLVDIARLAPATLTSMWEAVSAELRRTTPTARYYAEKLVGNTDLLIDSGIPLHLIDLVRDPRDVFCSIRAFSSGGAGFGRTADQSDEQFLEVMAVNHLQQLHAMTSVPNSVQRKLIRYEDLVADLPACAETLGNWLGLRLDAEQALATPERGHRTSATSGESIGRWRRELSPTLAARLWDVLGPELEPLGYQAT